MNLQNKTIIVTGASSGIGAAAAQLISDNGANVVLGARRQNELESLVKKSTVALEERFHSLETADRNIR